MQESSQLSGSDSTAISNGDKPAADNHSSEVEKHDDSSDKTEVQGSSQLSGSESTVIANCNKPAAESHSSEIEKQDEDISDKSEVQDCDSTALSNGKTDAESPSSETEKQEDNASQPDN